MLIQNPQSALLSNHEVFLHLQAEEAEYYGTDETGREREPPAGLRNALKDTLAHFNKHNAVHTLPSVAETHPERPLTVYKGPHSLFRALATKFRLNKAEMLQIHNLKPTTQVELQLIIEESHARFTEEQLDEMLAVIAHVFREDESNIPAGDEYKQMENIPNKLLGASKKRRRVTRK